ncbi:MAG: alanine--glyoxylate aminotransferase family protein [Clostridia bacterium]|nr:alanine--glyoxylate aminotransferase family protein [Clostridia bacterium]
MREKQVLMIPGPTNIPPRILHTLGAPAIGHRTPEYVEIVKDVTSRLKLIYQTKNDLFILSSTGTGAMEAAISNFINNGDKVLVMENGNFGERWAKINKCYGADVEVIGGVWGERANPQALKERIEKDINKEIKAVYVTHNETSTGVVNDVKALREAVGDHPALFIVDSISGMAVSPLKVDEWKLDVVVSGSQKAFMLPPGLAFVSVSQKAWDVSDKVTTPRFYFDLRAARKTYNEKFNTPYTSSTSLIIALQETLKIMMDEGLENIYKRHEAYKNLVRTAVKALGLELLTSEEAASSAVTAIKRFGDIDVKKVTKIMREKHNVVIAGGQGKLQKDIFRIGHLGYINVNDIVVTIAALERTLKELGMDIKPGQGVAAVQELLMKGEN